ncbi:outer membrane protein assembly factor BamB [Aestuariirhabdus sp. Z084]|uniref:outer membrane protein assembly factor BamB n=1 Tax=Aestuariirhabdus haliotis TaxID=2918751 RepID=UPI00201B3866|nr:outer membrane protein assembly factor BamB [Aestuariirhabdus haliotis]MCL6415357.1 outer membrane protein assembly factor BamB [Aestuariirhabdus haliotis]MCL6419113.1 outer membrane protein assembly factor BamB [Aestuariirhabdus haliotis]
MSRYKWPRMGFFVLLALLAGCGSNDSKEEPVEATPLISFDETAELETLWSTSVGGGTEGEYVRLQPALYRGLVYASDADGQVEALDQETGKRQWSTDLDLPVSSGVYAGFGLVVVGTQSGLVVALDAAEGKELWRRQVTSEVLSVADSDGDVVVVRTIDEKVVGLDNLSGERRWIFENSQPVLSLRGASDPVIEGDMVYVGFGTGELVALLARNGVQRWELAVAEPQGRTEIERIIDIDGSPLVLDGTLYVVSYQGNVSAIDAQRGELIWQRKASSYESLSSGFGYLYMTDDTGYLSALDKSSNAIIWQQKELKHRQLGTPAVVSSYVAVADFEGYVHFVSQVDGSFAARTRIDSDGIRGHMKSSGNVLFVYGNSGKLVAIKVR